MPCSRLLSLSTEGATYPDAIEMGLGLRGIRLGEPEIFISEVIEGWFEIYANTSKHSDLVMARNLLVRDSTSVRDSRF